MVSKKKILTALGVITGMMKPNEKTAEQFIELGLDRLNAEWFRIAIPAYTEAVNNGKIEINNKAYDPVPYLETFFNQNKSLAQMYIQQWWKYLEDIITDPQKLLLILLRKPDCRVYLNTKEGKEYVKWVASRVHDWLYDYAWSD